jgi:membrane-anchored protein YejM (alkaline phosphatase superfamily)
MNTSDVTSFFCTFLAKDLVYTWALIVDISSSPSEKNAFVLSYQQIQLNRMPSTERRAFFDVKRLPK